MWEVSRPNCRLFACPLAVYLAVLSAGCRVQEDLNTHSTDGSGAATATTMSNIRGTRLAPRMKLSSGPLFTQVSPAESAIDFVNHGATPQRNYLGEPINFGTNSGQHTAGGVCIGDYDADGLPDVFLTRPAGGNRLYRNLGNFHFADVTLAAGVSDDKLWGMGASFADVDNDGDLDLYLCCYDQPNRLYVNRGDGTFAESAAESGLDFRGASVMMAFMDYDRDGDLDAFLLTNALERLVPKGPVLIRHNPARGWTEVPEAEREGIGALVKLDGTVFTYMAGQYDHLFENRGANESGDVQFVDVSQQAGIEGTDLGLSAVWFDYDADGWTDLYVANDFFGPDRLYHNNGDGTFADVAQRALPHTPWFSMGADAGDVNNDGKFDLMASDMSGTTHYNQQVQVGDFYAERWFLNFPDPPQYMRNAVFLNAGRGRFMEVAQLAGLANSDWTWSVKFADMDCDGWLDVYITNGMTRDMFNSDFKVEENLVATREEAERFWQEKPAKRDRHMAFCNDRNLGFTNEASAWGLDHLGVGFGAAWGDLDGDGDLDLVVNNYDEPAAVYRNQSSGAHCVKLRLNGTKSDRWGIGSVISLETKTGTQVRQLKLASGYMSADEPIVHFGLGDETEIARLTIRWPSGHVQVFDELPADQLYMIAEPNGKPPGRNVDQPPPPLFARSAALEGVPHRETPFDDFARQPLLPNRLSRLGPGIAWGDIDGDGDDDLYVAGASGQAGQLFVRAPNGAFRAETQEVFAEDLDAEDMAPLFFDADADGDQDLYVVSGSVESPAEDRLYVNDGTGQFTRAPRDRLDAVFDVVSDLNAASRGAVCASDFDRDGDLDLFLAGRCVPGDYPRAPASELLRNEKGRFVPVAREIAPDLPARGMVTSALWSDADNDGWLDLLVTYDWGPVRLFHNEAGQRLVDATDRAGLADRLGWWNGIAGRDLDHDGDVDYVVTNFGLNTKYRATPERPVRIYYGDVDGSGRRQIVEAAVTDEGLIPIRGKNSSEEAIPVLSERFPTFHSYATASLTDIYTQERLNRCQVFEVNTLQSGVLLNDGHGRFEFRPLPRLAQASPSFGLALEDVDADGNPDVYLVQNFFSPHSETGRMDGGLSLLLTGDGHGNFTPVWPDVSGLVVPGDAKSLTVNDLNGDQRPDFVVGVNNGEVMAFENRSTRGRPFAVRLAGGPGNLTAVGARVSIHLFDGVVQSAEVSAGGGYLSQNGGQLYFGLGNSQVEYIEVRWPDGSTSKHKATEASRIEIKRGAANSRDSL